MRRRFGRPIRRLFAPDIPPLLQRANQMLSANDYSAAADAYEQLARAAEARGRRRAAFFYVQAGRCKAMAGKAADGVQDLERGLGLFAMRGRERKALDVGSRIIAELNARGLKTEAQQVSDYLHEIAPGFQGPLEPPPAVKRPALPTHCPGCGAPLRPDEVEWLDDATATCEYCGSPVHGA